MTEQGINKLWYQPRWAWAAWLLAPLALLFAIVSGLRRGAYRVGLLRSLDPGAPVIVVGNLTVGGSGKTPLIIWLARELQRRGHRVGVVSRGYGGRERGPALLPAHPDPDVFGDEPTLIAAATGVPVAIGAARAQAAELLVRSTGVGLLLSDDGLQHYALRRQCELVVVDAQRGFGNGWLLPAGPLRELPGRLRQASAVIRRNADGYAFLGRIPDTLPCFDMQTNPAGVRPLAEPAGKLTELSAWRGRRVHALAGIGVPERFFAALRDNGLDVIEHAAQDHHRWTAQELDFGDDLPVLMTGKDAVKCQRFARANWYWLDIEVNFSVEQTEQLLALLLAKIADKRI